MIEEIIEKSFNVTTELNITDTVVRLKDAIKILNKYHNQTPFKSAWEELESIFSNRGWDYEKYADNELQIVKKKYNLGGK